jgi:hypothetical protein
MILNTGALVAQQYPNPNTPDSLKVIHSIRDVITDFEVDNTGHLYLIGAQQQIKKLSPSYDSMAVFNEVRQFGKLFSIDVSNPLKVLLFYRYFGTIIILDRFLNTRTILNLRTADILQATAITQSYDNNIWIYDDLENRVKKIDESGRILLSSPDFRIIFDEPPQPQTLNDFNKFLFAYDSIKGLLVMDHFGAYKNKLSFLGWKNIHGISQGIVATDARGLVYYQPGTIETKHQLLPAYILLSKKIRIHNNQLFALDNAGKLTIYRLP